MDRARRGHSTPVESVTFSSLRGSRGQNHESASLFEEACRGQRCRPRSGSAMRSSSTYEPTARHAGRAVKLERIPWRSCSSWSAPPGACHTGGDRREDLGPGCLRRHRQQHQRRHSQDPTRAGRRSGESALHPHRHGEGVPIHRSGGRRPGRRRSSPARRGWSGRALHDSLDRERIPAFAASPEDGSDPNH